MSRNFVLLMLFLSVAANLAAGERYVGTVSAVKRDGSSEQVKTFSVIFAHASADPGDLLFAVSESPSRIPAFQRVGVIRGNNSWLKLDGPTIGHRHLDRISRLFVAIPYFPLDETAANEVNHQWESEHGEFRILDEVAVHDHPCWVIEATTGIARRHHFIVRKSNGIIEEANQTAFLGQGDRFRIDIKRDSSSEERTQVQEPLTRLSEIVSQMRSATNSLQNIDDVSKMTMPQLQQVIPFSESMKIAAANTPFEKIVDEISTELHSVQSRREHSERLAETLLGTTPGPFTLLRLDGTKIPSDSLEGTITVLHFWNYASTEIEQPYGQVSYLDFAARRFADQNVNVYGVAISPELEDATTREAALRKVRKFQSFLKFEYEVTTDAGAALNSLGNPTRFGESLPLWVVLNPNGEVAHYLTGFDEVDPAIGLKKLTEVLQPLIDESNAK
ncbi:TlpA disulfide reductase family protein [Thalassoglobus sp. JC818]|uniref:TlpA family protein disulfide reductase n=1 Tax=Thalassoglobus sp. JC818 TaxID=3232136 RepID=UPI0034576697